MNSPSTPLRTSAGKWLPLFALVLALHWVTSALGQSTTSYVLTNLWSIAPQTNTIINNDGSANLARGIAYNPATGHLLVVSRTGVPDFGTNVYGTNGIYILNATNGAVLGKLAYDTNVINGGNFPVNMVAVTDDGVIYVGNLTAATANGPFKLYRWANESAAPQLVYTGDPSGGVTYGASPQRYGDSIALRGTGTGTQILLGTLNQTLAVLTTADGVNFTASSFIVSTMAASDSRWGVAWGPGNTCYVKKGDTASTSGHLRLISLDTGLVLSHIPLTATAGTGGPIDVDLSRNLLGLIDTVNHKLLLYDISDPLNPIQQDVTKSFPAANANGNSVGSVALRDGKLFAMESNNGILAYGLGTTNLAAKIVTAPTSVTLWEGATYTMTAFYGGTRPLTYQWKLAGTNLPGATQASLTFTNLAFSQAGSYTVAVSNALGGAVSGAAVVTVTPANPSALATPYSRITPGSRRYMTYRPAGDSIAGYKEYGMAINPVTTNLIVVTRLDPTNMIAVMDIQGNHKYYKDYSVVRSFVDQMNRVDVADDGTVYVCNLSTSTSTPFKVFGFGDDSEASTDQWVAFNGDPGNGQTVTTNGWGGTFQVRGGGANTEMLIGGMNSAVRTFAILHSPDANWNFTSTVISVPTAPAGFGRLGICWGPDTNTVWAKTPGDKLYLIQYDRNAGSGTVVYSYPLTTGTTPFTPRFVPSAVDEIRYDPASKLLAGFLNYGTAWSAPQQPVSVVLYDLSDPEAGPFLVDQDLYSTFNSDIEFQGTSDFANGYLASLAVNNGIMVSKIDTNFVSLPRILTQPAGATVYAGTPVTLSVVADSTSGLSYQWYRNGSLVADATGSAYSTSSVQTNEAGVYTVRAINSGGYRESTPATLTVLVPFQTAQMTNVWTVAPGERTYLNTDYKEYGLAFNPANSNLLVVSLEGGGTTIALMDALTGEDKNSILDVSIVSGGTKVLHKIGVADDGVVYAGNVTTAAATTPFKLYRWDNDLPSTVPTLAYQGDPMTTNNPNKGVGYTFGVRGAGVNTEIIVGSNNTNVVAILKTVDGINFTAKEIKVAAAPGSFCRLGLCFGAGNTFWAKSWKNDAGAGKLYLVQYDLTAGTSTILYTYQTTQVSSTITTIGYDDTLKMLGGIATDSTDSVMVYDVSNLAAGPQLRDQELYPTYNASIEANGSAAFGAGNYLFTLVENNGIMAFRINAKYSNFKILAVTPAAGSVALNWEAVDGVQYQVQRAATANGTWSDLGTPVTATGTAASYTDTTPDPSMRFYRILVK